MKQESKTFFIAIHCPTDGNGKIKIEKRKFYRESRSQFDWLDKNGFNLSGNWLHGLTEKDCYEHCCEAIRITIEGEENIIQGYYKTIETYKKKIEEKKKYIRDTFRYFNPEKIS